jgi:hypothetical protein
MIRPALLALLVLGAAPARGVRDLDGRDDGR